MVRIRILKMDDLIEMEPLHPGQDIPKEVRVDEARQQFKVKRASRRHEFTGNLDEPCTNCLDLNALCHRWETERT